MFGGVSASGGSLDRHDGHSAPLLSRTDPEGRPRLLVLTADFPPARGGIQLHVHRIVTGLEAFDVRVVAPVSSGAQEFDAGGRLRVRRVGGAAGSSVTRVAALNASALLEAARWRPHLTLSAHIVTSPAAAAVRRMFGAPTVQYFYAKEIAGKPRLARFAARNARASVSISSYTSGLLSGIGAPVDRLSLIPPGVDVPADPSSLPCERPTFVTVSRLADRYKGHDVLMRSLALMRERIPDVEWVVIGDGPLRPELEGLARQEGVADSVRFLGAVSDEVRDGWLRRAHLLAMPSRLPGEGAAGEGFGIVYLEAAGVGKPVVAGAVGGALDAVLDGQTGLLVDPTDPAAVAAAITRLLLDGELAARLGEAGRVRAQSFGWPVIVEQVQSLLLEQLP
jgi:phosphatidyl-myo-inositol dimannoside synthase